MALTFRPLTKCQKSSFRGIGFLEGHKELDAGLMFDSMEGTSDGRFFRASMDQWLDGAHGPDTRFHNFKNDSEFRELFVFKCDEHRLYGFLCHPKDDDARFQLCVLCVHAVKRKHPGARAAIVVVYPPKLKGKQWKN
jgi:hypothetical protein